VFELITDFIITSFSAAHCITLRGHWCDVIVLNMHTPTEDKNDDTYGSLWQNISYFSTNKFRSTGTVTH